MKAAFESARSASAAIVGLAALFFGACTVPADAFEELPCPCGEGWFCSSRRVCVPEGDDRDPPAVEPTCWQERLGCDWSQAGAFVFEEDEGDVISLSAADANLSFSPDGCTVFVNRAEPDRTDTTDIHIFEATRAGPDEAFGDAARIEEIGSAGSGEGKATMSPDGLELYYLAAETLGVDVARVFRSERARVGDAWGPGAQVDNLSAPGIATFDMFLAPHGLRAYFSRPTLASDQDILVAERANNDAPFGPPRTLDEVSMGVLPEVEPIVSADGRVMTYVTIPALGATRQLYYATRTSWRNPWTPRGAVPGDYFTEGDEFEGAISPDACEILVRRGRDIRRFVYRSTAE